MNSMHRSASAGPTPPRPGAAHPSPAPTQKVLASTAGAALGSTLGMLLVWVINHLVLPPDQPLSEQFQGALIAVVSAGLTLIFGYHTPPGTDEQVVVANGVALSARV